MDETDRRAGDAFRPTRRGLLALGGAFTLAGGVASCSGPPESTPKRSSTPQPKGVTLNFGDGSLRAPITGHVGAKVGREFGKTGRYGCRLKPRKSNDNLASLVVDRAGFAPDSPWATFSMSFRLVTQPKRSDQYMNLFEIGTTATKFPKSQFTVYFKKGILVCDFNSSELMEIAPMPTAGTWHKISAVVNYGASVYTARVRFDGQATKKLQSKDDKTPEVVSTLWIHYPKVPVDYTMDIDEVRMTTSKIQPSFLSVS